MRMRVASLLLWLAWALAPPGCTQSPATHAEQAPRPRWTPALAPSTNGSQREQVPNSVVLLPKSRSGRQPVTLSRVFAPGDIPHWATAVVNGKAVNTQCDVKTRWRDGSLQHAVLSFWVEWDGHPVIVDFEDRPQPLAGEPLDAGAMLSSRFDFGATLTITSRDGKVLTADARKMLERGAFRYWLRGPICTQVIVEDRTPARGFDLGWDEYRPFHPIFVATFYPGWRGVKLEVIGENLWAESLEDLNYALEIRVGPPGRLSTAYTKELFTHYAMTRWRKVFWSGIAPQPVAIDFNFPYMISSQVLPTFDVTRKLPRDVLDAEWRRWQKTGKGDINDHGYWVKYFPSSGGREDLGLAPTWVVRYLYSFDPRMLDIVLGNAAASGHIPIHLRESATGRPYLRGSRIDAFGRPLSLHARPTFTFLDLNFVWTAKQDRVRFVGPVSSGHGWVVDLAHQGSFAFVPYLVTGDWYFLEEAYFWAAYDVAHGDPNPELPYGRGGDYGFLNPAGIQTRGVGWGLRNIGHAAFLAPDGSPEKAYFLDKLYANIAAREGQHDLRAGAFYDPHPGSPWSWGRRLLAGGGPNPLRFQSYPSDDRTNNAPFLFKAPPNGALRVEAPWTYSQNLLVLGHLEELGFPIGPLRRYLAVNLLHQLQDPEYNPYLSAAYVMPVVRASDQRFFQTWREVLQAWRPDHQTIRTWPGNDAGDVDYGWPHITRAAASFLPGIEDGDLQGAKAWNWIHKTLGNQPGQNANPKWALVPRNSISLREAWMARLRALGIRPVETEKRSPTSGR